MTVTEMVRLGDQLDFSAGATSPPRDSDGGYPVYGANGVIGFAAEHNAPGPLIVIGRVGSYCGSLHYHHSSAWVSDNAFVCRAKRPEETRYWYYALQTCGLNRFRVGSGQPLLNQSILENVTACTVPPAERGRIGEVLGALDDKIAANRRAVDAAEALMLAIVGSIGADTPLSNLASRSTACLDPPKFRDTLVHYSIPAFDADGQPSRIDGHKVKSAKFQLSEPCVLFSKLNPRIPRVWDVTSLPTEMCLASMEFVVLRPTQVTTSALWAALRQPDVSVRAQQIVVGVTGSRQRIQPNELLRVRVKDSRHLTVGQSETIANLGALCHGRRIETAQLAARRDALLPLLISGTAAVRA
ncbi:restriction endonuclease subunit S [Mycobacterium asiaticum]|uniref:Restriction endonuclease subunit S n=1 Tax=Mycobacterium asiaticum TaxID=1790 RepID=A0A1A3NMV6_MYCAS|nr:restriction endonuclease subunit S [Mycobacterium asiaticum]OBK21667.1 restriction endonuclease subunit S [Mycobacterium asiaticum]